jgi:nitrogen regulatory protein PII
MIGEKYIGLDVHQATICVAVMDSKCKVVMESILETTTLGSISPGRIYSKG